MGSPTSAALAARPAVAHYHLTLDGAPTERLKWTLHVAEGRAVHTSFYETKRAALADLRKQWPGAKRVPASWFAPVALARPAAPDTFAEVRAAGHVWGKIDAVNDHADDSHKAYCWRFPAEACSTTPPPGHAEAFRSSYDSAYAAEMRGRRGGL
jgi:hypothetical protein